MSEVEVDRFDLTKFSFTVEYIPEGKKWFLVVKRKLNA